MVDPEALLSAFERLARDEATRETHRFCIFLDALDEYEGTHNCDSHYMVQLLQEWVNGSHRTVKVCASSREHNVFEDAFRADQRIRMQDLTKTDMQQYVLERLKNIMGDQDRQRVTGEIVRKSDGIFLWVVLVVKAMREGVNDGHDVSRLERELEMLPTKMEQLFQYLLDSIPAP